MASGNSLTTTTNSGSQNAANTANLQSSVAANGISGGTPATIQPGTDTSVLLSSGGIPLSVGSLPAVALGQTTTQTATVAPAQHHKINPVALGFSVTLFVAGLLLFWFMGRAEKKTTI